jgi:hypothetical protein
MKIVKASVFLFTFLCLSSGLAYGQKVTTDYDKKADFSRFKTYMWVGQPKLSNPLMSQRVVDDVNAQLTAKGWTMVTENADAAVVVNGATKDQQTLDTFYSGYPGWRWSWGGGEMATTTVEHYRVGTLVIDILDAKSKQAMFRGVATDTLSDKPEKNEEKLNKSVEKIFKNFPPESKS